MQREDFEEWESKKEKEDRERKKKHSQNYVEGNIWFPTSLSLPISAVTPRFWPWIPIQYIHRSCHISA